MTEGKILGIIDELEEKLRKWPNSANMHINNINNNFQNINNINNINNTNHRNFDEFMNKSNNSNFNSNNFNSNIHESINENYIRRIIKEELPGFIYQYQQDLSNRMNYLESKLNKINKKLNNNNIDLNSNNISIEQGNKISEMEYKLLEIESFFKQWKEIIKDNDDNIYKSRVKLNNEQELKLMQLDTKLSNQLKIIYDKINADINDIKKSMEKIKNNGIEINKLEV